MSPRYSDTHQTGESGQKVRKILIEEASNISKEFYCAITLDRSLGQFVFMVSTEGGMEIEKVAEFESNLFDYLEANASDQLSSIRESGDLSDDTSKSLDKLISDFKNSFAA